VSFVDEPPQAVIEKIVVIIKVIKVLFLLISNILEGRRVNSGINNDKVKLTLYFRYNTIL
jgi:hypothetical protein